MAHEKTPSSSGVIGRLKSFISPNLSTEQKSTSARLRAICELPEGQTPEGIQSKMKEANSNPDVSRATVFLQLDTIVNLLERTGITITDNELYSEEDLQRFVDGWTIEIIKKHPHTVNFFIQHELKEERKIEFDAYLIKQLGMYKKQHTWQDALEIYFIAIRDFLDYKFKRPSTKTGPLGRITGNLGKK